MENQYNLSIKSGILEKQGTYLLQRAREQLGAAASREDVVMLANETLKRYYAELGSPLLVERKAEPGHLPFVEEYNESIQEIAEDLSLLFSESEVIGNYLSDYFNYAQSERMRLQYRIRGIGGLASDLNLIANDTTENSLYFRDSFEDASGLEPELVMGEAAQVSTTEGIVTLAREASANRSLTARIKAVQGNGEAGTYHLMRETKSTQSDGTMRTGGAYVSDQSPNTSVEAILDGRPDTIFEYQMVNAPLAETHPVTKGYDMEWAKGEKEGDKLRLKLTVELPEAADINWLNINPYYPALSTGKVTVYSVRTSEDGFDYRPLYDGGNFVLNSEINTTPQTYRVDAVFDGSNDFTASKFAGQGVWAFPTRKAKYVEIVLDQNESYEERIGHTYYEKVKRGGTGETLGAPVRMREVEVPENIRTSPPGQYTFDSDTDIVKGIEGFQGWRYAIGIRDVNLMSYRFKPKSELVTKRHETKEAIAKVMLYVNEKIPASYLEEVTKGNDWIQYFISIDDVNWHRISPMHHEPVGEAFPPKIYEINGNRVELAEAFQLHKAYLDSDKPVTGVRLKVLFQRPDGLADGESSTPVLEDYALRVMLKDEHIQE